MPSLFQHRAFLSSRSPHIAYPEVVIDVRRISGGNVTGPPLLPKLPRQTTVLSALTPHVCPFPAMTSTNCGIGVGVAVGVLVGVGVGTGVAVGVGSSTTAEGVASGVAVTTTSLITSFSTTAVSGSLEQPMAVVNSSATSTGTTRISIFSLSDLENGSTVLCLPNLRHSGS